MSIETNDRLAEDLALLREQVAEIRASLEALKQDHNEAVDSMAEAEVDQRLTLPAPGTLRLVHAATAPDGWLLCDGSEQRIDQYPELAAAVLGAYNGAGASAPDAFVLPAKADLTADAVLLALTGVNFIVKV